MRFAKKLLHQRCTIHKDRNIQKHLAKKYRKEAHWRFRTALEQSSYEDARRMLLDTEKWLRGINMGPPVVFYFNTKDICRITSLNRFHPGQKTAYEVKITPRESDIRKFRELAGELG
jgi:hypothetical protein